MESGLLAEEAKIDMKPYQLVLDTNVLVAGLRSNQGNSYKLLTISLID